MPRASLISIYAHTRTDRGFSVLSRRFVRRRAANTRVPLEPVKATPGIAGISRDVYGAILARERSAKRSRNEIPQTMLPQRMNCKEQAPCTSPYGSHNQLDWMMVDDPKRQCTQTVLEYIAFLIQSISTNTAICRRASIVMRYLRQETLYPYCQHAWESVLCEL